LFSGRPLFSQTVALDNHDAAICPYPSRIIFFRIQNNKTRAIPDFPPH